MPRHAQLAKPLAAALLALAALSGCYGVQVPETAVQRPDQASDPVGNRTVTPGGDLVMGLSAEPDRLDPTSSSSLYTRYVMNSICEKLYDIDARGELVPQLATALPKVSANGLKVTIPVRDDIVFADDEPFNAEAVKTTLQRHLTKKDSTRKGELGPISSIEAPTSTSVVINYKTPFAPLAASLADRAGMILSPRTLDELGDNFGDRPTCVGPFKFVARIPQTSIEVEKDPLYYAADQVRLETITYRIMADANIRAANLRSGDIHVADSVSTQDVDALIKEDGIGLLQVGSLGYQAMTINVGNVDGAGTEPGKIDTPLASDPRVRLALHHAIDREGLVNSVFNNWYQAACSPISPVSPFATERSNECLPYDPARSQALLAEAGVEVPFPIRVSVTNVAESLRLAQAMQAAVAPAGFDLQIEPVEYSTLLDVQAAGDFESLLLGWSGRIDPHGNMFNFLTTAGGNNYSGYSNETADRLLSKAARSTDPAERADAYASVVEQLREDNPIIYLYRIRNLAAYTTNIAGAEMYPDGVVRLSRVAFVEREDD